MKDWMKVVLMYTFVGAAFNASSVADVLVEESPTPSNQVNSNHIVPLFNALPNPLVHDLVITDGLVLSKSPQPMFCWRDPNIKEKDEGKNYASCLIPDPRNFSWDGEDEQIEQKAYIRKKMRVLDMPTTRGS